MYERGLEGYEPIHCGTEELEEVNCFKYLGSELSKDGGMKVKLIRG